MSISLTALEDSPEEPLLPEEDPLFPEEEPLLPEEEPEEEVTDPELIAVIAAAIAAFDSSNKPLVVRKVRRVSGWNRSARAEQVYRF